jgi:hypothetical protein
LVPGVLSPAASVNSNSLATSVANNGTSGLGSGPAAVNAATKSGAPSGPSAGSPGGLANTGLPVLVLLVGFGTLLAGGFLSWKRAPA